MTNIATGHFQITVHEGEPIRVTAIGYSPAEFELPQSASDPINLGVIELVPLPNLAIIVSDSRGQPSPEAEVYALEQAESTNGVVSEAKKRIGVTDRHGFLHAALSKETLLFAARPDRVSPPMLAAPSDGRVELHLPPFPGKSIGVRNELPVADLPLQLTKQDAYPWIRYHRETTVDGMIDGAIPPGEYFVESLDPGIELTGNAPSRFGTPLVHVSVGGPDVVWIDARVSSEQMHSITLVDKATREPLMGASGWIASYEVPPFMDPPGWVALGAPVQAPDGGPKLGLGLFPILEEQDGLRLYVCAPGYDPEFIEQVVIEAASKRQPLEVPLSKSTTCSLRLTDADGRGFRHPVYVRDNQRHVAGPLLPVDGRIVFPWSGDAVVVKLGPHEDSHVVVEVSASLATEPSQTLVLQDLGVITVEDVPESSVELWCGDGRGFSCEPLHVSNQLVFDQLPPGRYDIGPRGKVDNLAFNVARGRSLPIALGASENVRIAWSPDWTLETTLHGKVMCIGVDPTELFVVPLYTDPSIPVTTGERVRRYPLGADGTYRISGSSGMPTLIALSRRLANGALWPVGVLDPDGSGSVMCARVSLSIENAAASDRYVATVRAKVDGHAAAGIAQFDRVGPGTLDLGSLPVGTGQLELSSEHAGRRTIDLKLEPGVDHVVRVDATTMK